jgi:Holliday junction DNA helicase RuvA
VPPAPTSAADDAVSALVNLGYRRPEAAQVVARIADRLGEGVTLDALIRDSLKELAQKAAG